jgi:Fe-S cluster biogenesis protein NfuA
MSDVNGLSPELAASLQRLQELVDLFGQHPDPLVQQRAIDLLKSVDHIHRAGLRRMAELLRISGLEQPALGSPEVRLLFDLYDLGEDGDRVRAEALLESIRPYIASHGGRLEVLKAKAGVVTVRLSGACESCPSSDATIRHVIQRKLSDGLPDFVRVEVVE